MIRGLLRRLGAGGAGPEPAPAARAQGAPEGPDRGLLVFENTSEVIRAQKLLRDAGVQVAVMGPPPEIRKGCDLVVTFPLVEELRVRRLLAAGGGPQPLEVVPVTGPLLTPVDIFQVKDFGTHLMVRAANMKLTVDKSTGVLVNVSGGGCPDVPYLAALLVGRRLDEAPSPREMGHTLCGYALGLAFEELQRRCSPS
ncbi:DUF3343 domain-containing protein [Desulfocurvus sp.]|uniref:DUF3343 domain-containing protein n=1 Tax=Desulfocurvus sp. TaxID=2871698 RepID=UPI0025BC6FD3|nr:DUF3343 domain-containing protein [Desulfocurvus sp.]MCK9240903.1 DUF3343 domain-containing protein [Desulfocurvus sp.]